MKKQRWRFTKITERSFCTGCGKRLDLRDSYQRRYGFHNMFCGYDTYGLSVRDFY
jgi:hypothetical protein